MTPYEKLRARINELLPDRMTLGFGCEIDTGNNIITLYADDGKGRLSFFDREGDTMHGSLANLIGNHTEILGTPLTLADVLRAIDKVYPHTTHWTVKNDTLIHELSSLALPLAIPVSQWSEETLTKILDLISP